MNKITFKSTGNNFSKTKVENIFINKYMPNAKGDYVKIYLYGLKNSQFPEEACLGNEELAQLLHVDPETINKAYNYWRSLGVIEVEGYGEDITITFVELSEKLPDPYEPKTSRNIFSAKHKTDKEYAGLIATAEEMLGGQILPQSFIRSLDKWIDVYNFEYDCIGYLLEYCLTTMNPENYNTLNGKINYLNKVAENWSTHNIKTAREAMIYSEEYKFNNHLLNQILKELGLRRAPMRYDRDLFDKWVNDFNFDAEIIMEGVRRTSVPNLNYLDKILTSWNQKHYTSIDQVRSEKKVARASKKPNLSELSATDEQIRAAQDIESKIFENIKNNRRTSEVYHE